MGSQPIRRSNYLPPDDGFDCVNDGRAIDADFASYHEPRWDLHHRGLHGEGVALGLELGGTLGVVGLKLSHGVAIDSQGRMVVLPESGGTAQLEGVGGTRSVREFGDVLDVPTRGFSGELFVTIEHHEELVGRHLAVAPCKTWEQQPIVRLRTRGQLDGRNPEVVLGHVTLDASGSLQGLDEEGRHVVGAAVGELRFKRPVAEADFRDRRAQDRDAGRIAALPDGSLHISAPSVRVDENLSVGGDLHAPQIDALTAQARDLSGRLEELTRAFRTLYDGDLHPDGTLRVSKTLKSRRYHFPLWTIRQDPGGGAPWQAGRVGLQSVGISRHAGILPIAGLPDGTRIHSLVVRSFSTSIPDQLVLAFNVLDHRTNTLDSSRTFVLPAVGEPTIVLPDPIIIENNHHSYDLSVSRIPIFAPPLFPPNVTLVTDIAIVYDLVRLY